jgi:hypothetical protein
MNIRINNGKEVPARYRGVWTRTLLQAPGLRDTDTSVFWLQTARWHADIRIPAGRPAFTGVYRLEDCSDVQLQWLARQQGFAGITRVDTEGEKEVCQWDRVVDYQPLQEVPDAGLMRFEDGMLIETGIHAEYLEHWHLLPGSSGHGGMLERNDDTGHFIILAGDYAIHVRARADECKPPSKRVPYRSELIAWLDFELSLAQRIKGDDWLISRSTLPWQEGRRFRLQVNCETNSAQTEGGDLSFEWRIREWSNA